MKPTLFLFALAALAFPVRAKEPFRPNLGPDLARITVKCGDLTLLLRQASQWTPGRIDFRGEAMTTERSAYGTVFSFPNLGFVGTGHLENEPEPLVSLRFFLDGVEVKEPKAELTGGSFRFERESEVRGFHLSGAIELKDDRLYETTTVSTATALPLNLVYHFMHAWVPTVSEFLAGSDSPPTATGGALTDAEETARKFHIVDRVDWVAVYEPVSGQFAVSRLLAAPSAGGHVSMIWNVPGTYRKYYLKCFDKETVPAGFKGTWRMVTGFGAAAPDAWQGAAKKLAGELAGEE